MILRKEGGGGGPPLAEKIQVVFESFPKDGPNFASKSFCK